MNQRKSIYALLLAPTLSLTLCAWVQAQNQGQAQGQTQSPPSASESTSAAATPSANDLPDNYPRVTGMERAVLNQTYQSDPLPARLSRLEEKAFGKSAETLDLSTRTDNLQDYVEQKLHKSVLPPQNPANSAAAQEQSQSQSQSQGQPGGGSFLAKAASALIGIPVGGAGAGQGFFAPGFGPFGGVRVRPRSAVAQDASPVEDPRLHQFDEVVNSNTPPPANTRAAAKVAWCEKQLFGQVFYNKHLTERLTELNDRLNFAPGKQGSDLLDDIDKLVKATAAKQAAASPGSATH